MTRLVLAALVLLVGLTALAWAMGFFLPERQVVRLRSVFPRPVEDLWALLNSGHFGLAVQGTEVAGGAGHRRLTAERPAGDRCGGLWTLELEPVEGGCALTIHQERRLASPLVRSLARVFAASDSEVRAFRDQVSRELELDT